MAARDETLDPDKLLKERAWLRRMARGLVQDDAAADDLAQETLGAALSSRPRDKASRPGWLQGIARNLARSRARGEGRRVARERRVARREAVPSTESVVARLEIQREIVDAVMGLSEVNRQVVVLHYFEGRSAARIAKDLGIPASSVRSRLRRSLEKLRERLDRRTDGGRAAWLALVVPLAHEGGVSLAALEGTRQLVEGALVMTAKKSAAVAVCAVLVLGGVVAWRLLDSESGPERPERGPRTLVESTGPEVATPEKRETPLVTEPFEAPTPAPAPEPAAKPKVPPKQATTGIVKGRVLVEGEGPLTEGHVFLWGYDEAGCDLDAEGRFEMETRFVASRSIYWKKDGLMLGFPADVRPRLGDTVEVLVKIVRGVEVRGHLEIEGTAKRLGNARLTLRAAYDDATKQAEAVFFKADQRGGFAVPLVPPGRYRLEIEHPEATPTIAEIEVPDDPHGFEPLVITVPPIRPLRVTLVNYRDYREKFDIVSIQAFQYEIVGSKGERRMTTQHVNLRAHPDEDGRFEVAAPAPGWWHWNLFSYAGFPRQSGDLQIPEGTDPVDWRVELPVRGRTTVRGQVKDPEGRAFGPARIQLGERTAKVGQDGRFRFENIRAGRHDFTLRRTAQGAETIITTTRIDVPTIDEFVHDLVLAGIGRIDVRFTDLPEARRADDVSCSLQDAEGHNIAWAHGTPDRPASFPGLAPGRYKVHAKIGCIQFAIREVEVTGERKPLDVAFPVGELQAATFRFDAPPGVALPKKVHLFAPPLDVANAPRRTLVDLALDGDGSVSTELFLPGNQRLQITADGFENVELNFTPGSPEPIDVMLHRR